MNNPIFLNTSNLDGYFVGEGCPDTVEGEVYIVNSATGLFEFCGDLPLDGQNRLIAWYICTLMILYTRTI